MSDLRARAEKLASLGAATPQSNETNSAARALAQLLVAHPELLREPSESEEGEGFNPLSALEMAMAEIEKQVNAGFGPPPKQQPKPPPGKPPVQGASFVGYDNHGRPVWNVPMKGGKR